MATIIFRFVEPCSFIGRIITWRLKEPFSHVAILIDDTAYSAQIPYVAMLPVTHKSVAMPPRKGKDVVLEVTQEECQKIKNWCESHIGRSYDLISILGWIFGMPCLQSKTHTYCFEYCRKAVEQMGWLEPVNELIKGNRLLADLQALARQRQP